MASPIKGIKADREINPLCLPFYISVGFLFCRKEKHILKALAGYVDSNSRHIHAHTGKWTNTMAAPQASPDKHIIDIEWLKDDHECDTCGWDYAEGARVSINGRSVLDLEPSAHCFDSNDWNFSDVMALIILELGGFVIVNGEILPRGADPAEKRRITLKNETIYDETIDSHRQSMRAVIEGVEAPILDWPGEAQGAETSYYTQSQAMARVATYLGANFTPGSFPYWVGSRD